MGTSAPDAAADIEVTENEEEQTVDTETNEKDGFSVV